MVLNLCCHLLPLNLFVLDAERACYEDVTGPGDIIYYPKRFWHQTDNLEDDTVTVAHRRVDGDNVEEVVREIVDKCHQGPYCLHPNASLLYRTKPRTVIL